MQIERWLKFSRGQQIGAIVAEIARAKTWQKTDRTKSLSAIERALELIDSTINDKRWQGQRSMLFWLRQELSKFYLDDNRKDIGVLYNAL